MKAVLFTQYGSPEVLKIGNLEKPTPKENEVLIKVHAGVVTPSDTAFRMGKPFIIKLIYGLKKPRNPKQGVEFAGKIEAVGANVSKFRVGDDVFGMSPDKFGAHAEYMTLPETGVIAKKSPHISYADMVGICDGAATAMWFLRNVGKIQRGQKVLINGASGAVGAYGVQIAKHFGAEVTAVCSTRNVELVKSLGADKVIDYTKTDFTRTGDQYDLIFDAVGKSTFGKCKRALKRNGVYMNTVPSLKLVGAILRTAFLGGKKAKFTTAGLKQNSATMDYLTELTEQGVLKAVIDRCYPLDEIVEAHRYVDTGRKRGNAVITVSA